MDLTSKNVLILMSRTGGGHLACARALQAAFPAAYTVQIADLLIDHMPWPLSTVPRSYAYLADKRPRLWQRLWRGTQQSVIADGLFSFHAQAGRARALALLQACQPHMIVAVHPLVHQIAFSALDQMAANTPYFTVVTDPVSAHPRWFHPRTDLCFVATPAARAHAVTAGLEPSQVRVQGFPIHPSFAASPLPQPRLRSQLGVDVERPLALVMGGGDGMGRMQAIVHALAHRLTQVGGGRGQIAVICGRNQRLAATLARTSWPVPVAVRGHVDNVAAWMNASDCIITKAGPGAIFEAMAAGLPMVLSGHVPGQEEGNVDYVLAHEIGVYEQDVTTIAEIVATWLADPHVVRSTLGARARRLARPQGARCIVSDMLEAGEW